MKTEKTETKGRFVAALVCLLMYWITVQMMLSGFERIPDAVPRLAFTLSCFIVVLCVPWISRTLARAILNRG